ncbi:MAG: taurine dioxygenase [Gammaproteobacteria bacterium]|nr:taurine dioxygenase [Gammaproteobacteria bacterium]MCP4090999.1 taurine dioxygenase [Gammaproteobacteria bacterium]MCP4277475.1 taurine dioxygenase [Gammaproteobacteria bacterium]MCP4831464.1 taurine dioxygenase [Gammaproteobacteria bacterium]MCP4928989.1 taurine dioxygenase [Gammaproteobacteria bacterium]
MTYEISAVRQDPDFNTFTPTPVAAALGANIQGLDISQPLSSEAAAEIQQALVHYHVLFFNGLNLTPAQHTAFAKIFGKVQMGGTVPRLDEQPEVKKQEYTQQASVGGDINMHADDTFKDIPSKCSLLYGVDMPPAGGDTIWINTEAAYAALSKGMQQMLDELTAIHDLAARFGLNSWGNPDHKMRQKIEEHYPPVMHPVIKVHPESGRKSIYVNEMVTTRINDIPEDESTLLLEFLFKHLTKPDFQVRLHWPKTGTLVVWDNRSTQHQVLADFQPQYRLNHRVAIEDTEKPKGPAEALKSVA